MAAPVNGSWSRFLEIAKCENTETFDKTFSANIFQYSRIFKDLKTTSKELLLLSNMPAKGKLMHYYINIFVCCHLLNSNCPEFGSDLLLFETQIPR